VFRLVATGSSSFQAHYNAPKMWAELKHASLPRYGKVVTISFLFAALTSVYIMVIGYLTFGGNSAGLVLNNYSYTDPIAAIARVSVVFGIIFGYPLSFSALREGVWDLAGIISEEEKEFNHLSTTVLLLGVLVGCAITIDNVGVIISLSGALFGTMLIYIFPAVMNISAIEKIQGRKTFHGNEVSSLQQAAWLQYGLIAVGIVVAIIGTILNIENLM
jgi:amino acid permease